jgi:hypothetical protein
MSQDKPKLREGRRGAALAIRVIPRAKQNEVVEIMNDGAIKIRLAAGGDGGELNQTLIDFLSGVLGVPQGQIEVIAGENQSNKLVSVLNINSEEATQKIIASLS